ncbi:MAG: M48 family metallopeptidase [Bacteroidales bacterium]|nr:M48 family metallopeptidase [Bacteroidales bacterium]
MNVTLIFWLVIAINVLEYIYTTVMDLLSAKAAKQPVPELLNGIYDDSEYRRQQDYFAANKRFGRISTLFSVSLTLVLFSCGVFGWLADVVVGWTSSEVLQTFIFTLILDVVMTLVEIPFDLYETFVIEENFGFNKTTPKTFVADIFKGILLEAVLSSGLMSFLTAVYNWMPEYFWLTAFGVMTVFTLFVSYFYSKLIVPIFNKQTPLPEGELRDAITAFAKDVDFRMKDIYVMDGSRRTTHANAYFTGFGKNKRIVLYDTLIEQLSTDETLAVLAHEMGHAKKKHSLKSMPLSLASTFILTYVLGLVLGSDAIAQAAGASGHFFAINLMVLGMLWTPISIVMGIWENMSSRKHEWEADEFARQHGLGESLSSALKKLSKKNLSNLTPHPAVVFMSYSHPTLLQRVEHMAE